MTQTSPQEQVAYVVKAKDDGQTVYFVLRERMGVSEAIVRNIRRLNQGVQLDGTFCRTDALVRPGQTVSLTLFDSGRTTSIQPELGPVDIVFEDDHLLVANKPAGLVVHPSRGHFEGTLSNFVAYYLNKRGCECTAHPVNRLDKDTTGLIVFAKHAHAQNVLTAQMHTDEFERTYLAVCEGTFARESGVVNAPIARLRDEYGSFGVSPEGKPAVTHYQVLSCAPNPLDESTPLSLVQLRLETGRTHQIRVHMAHLGHPLLGDDAYGRSSELIARCALHSWRLAVNHPITGERLNLQAPIPADMAILPVIKQLPAAVLSTHFVDLGQFGAKRSR